MLHLNLHKILKMFNPWEPTAIWSKVGLFCLTMTKGFKWHWLSCVCFNYTIYIMGDCTRGWKFNTSGLHWKSANCGRRQTKLLSSSACICEGSFGMSFQLMFLCKWYSWKRLKGAMSLRSFCHGTAVLVSKLYYN